MRLRRGTDEVGWSAGMTSGDYRAPDRNAFGRALKAARMRRRVSQPELARAAGLQSHSRISTFESGAFGDVTPELVFTFEQLLRCRPGELSGPLGYYPPGALRQPPFAAAVDAEAGLTPEQKRGLVGLYGVYMAENTAGAR